MSSELLPKYKILPYSCTKKQLVEMYLDQMSECEIRDEINTILIKNGASKHKQKIKHHYFETFVQKHGIPKGYTEEK